jgi:peptide/nickel transport system permease protein
VRLHRYIALRLLQLIPLILVVIVINFVLMQMAPGDVASTLAGEDVDPAYLNHIRSLYGLDRPILAQLLSYLGQVLQGDLGFSFRSREPVIREIMQRIPATLLLVGTSLLIGSIVGTAIGTLLARRPGSFADTTVSTIAIAIYSVPVFWLGLMLILLFGVQLRWFPTSGMVGLVPASTTLGHMADVANHMVLPALALSSIWMGQYMRIARTSVAQVMGENYITTVRAIGFPERTVLLHYALRNALLPVVTMFGLQMGLVLAGAVLTETVFAWPGLGRLIYESILARDIPMIMGAYVVMSITVAVASLLTDLAYARPPLRGGRPGSSVWSSSWGLSCSHSRRRSRACRGPSTCSPRNTCRPAARIGWAPTISAATCSLAWCGVRGWPCRSQSSRPRWRQSWAFCSDRCRAISAVGSTR